MNLLANVGTPLVWLGIAHLLILNLIIGAIEGLWIAKRAGLPKRRAVLVMVVANYASAWAGAATLPWILWQCRDWAYVRPPLYVLEWLLIGIALLAFVCTVIIELPFVLLALRKSSRQISWRLRTAAVVQLVSYSGLLVLYLLVSSLSVLTSHTRIRNLATFVPSLDAWVYYIDRSGDSVWRVSVRGEHPERVAAVERGEDKWDRLALWLKHGTQGTVDLMVGSSKGSTELVKGIQGFMGEVSENSAPDRPQTNWPIDFRPQNARPFSYVAGFWAEEGLVRTIQGTQYRENINTTAFATALWRWNVAWPTILPTGHVVFGMGDQVLIMDEQNRIGALAIGTSPVVILKQKP